MQTITTKYHGATNTLGSRISATTTSGIRIYRNFNCELSSYGNELGLVRSLVKKLGWTPQRYVVVETKDGSLFVPDQRSVVL